MLLIIEIICHPQILAYYETVLNKLKEIQKLNQEESEINIEFLLEERKIQKNYINKCIKELLIIC
jgi:hypothetical protein